MSMIFCVGLLLYINRSTDPETLETMQVPCVHGTFESLRTASEHSSVLYNQNIRHHTEAATLLGLGDRFGDDRLIKQTDDDYQSSPR